MYGRRGGVLLSFLLTFSLILLWSCSNSSSSDDHAHSYDTAKWASDAASHWHAATCGHDAKSDEAKHDFDDQNKCKVCGYEKKADDNNQNNNNGDNNQNGENNGQNGNDPNGGEQGGGDVPAHEHKAVDVAAKAATCTEDGNKAGKKCSVCGEILEGAETVPALGHDWGEFTTDPKTGDKTAVCKRSGCGEKRTVVALGGIDVELPSADEEDIECVWDEKTSTITVTTKCKAYSWEIDGEPVPETTGSLRLDDYAETAFAIEKAHAVSVFAQGEDGETYHKRFNVKNSDGGYAVTAVIINY